MSCLSGNTLQIKRVIGRLGVRAGWDTCFILVITVLEWYNRKVALSNRGIVNILSNGSVVTEKRKMIVRSPR